MAPSPAGSPPQAEGETSMLQEEPAKEIVRLIRRMVSRIYVSSKGMMKRFGLTGPQVLVMRTLLNSGPMPSSTLADVIFVTPSNLTGIIDRLEQKGLVARARQTTDRRVLLLALTETGTRKAESLPDPIEEKLAAGLARLDAERASSVLAAVETVVGFMDAESAPDLPFDLHWSPDESPDE